MSWNLALEINKLTSITRVSGSSILIYNSTGTLLASYATTGLFLGDATLGSSSVGTNSLVLPSYGNIRWAGLTAFPPKILSGGGANLFLQAGVSYTQSSNGLEKGCLDFAYNTDIMGNFGIPVSVSLTYVSAIYQHNNNSSTTTYFLPTVGAGTKIGTFFIFNNNGGSAITIQNVSSTTLHTGAVGSIVKATLSDISTAPNGTWEISSELPSNVNWGTSGASYNGNLTLTGTHDFTTSATGKVNTITVASLASTNLNLTSVNEVYLLSGGTNLSVSMGNTSAPYISSLYDNGSYYIWDYGKRATGYTNPPIFNLWRPDQTRQAGIYLNNSDQFVIAYNTSAGVGTSWAYINGTGGTVWIFPSDARLKNSIVDLPSQTEKLMRLRPVNYKTNAQTDDKVKYGFIAQEVKEIYPEFISIMPKQNADDEDYYGMGLPEFVPCIVKVVQEQQVKITSLEAQLASLKAVVDALVAQKEILVV